MSKSTHYKTVNDTITNDPLFKAAPNMLLALKAVRDTLASVYKISGYSTDVEMSLTFVDSVIKEAEQNYCAICGQESEGDVHESCAQNQ